jgi:hypothetical protein
MGVSNEFNIKITLSCSVSLSHMSLSLGDFQAVVIPQIVCCLAIEEEMYSRFLGSNNPFVWHVLCLFALGGLTPLQSRAYCLCASLSSRSGMP